MLPFLIVLVVFSFPVALVGLVAHYRYKTRLLATGDGAAQKRLIARCEELEQRLQTLETIITESDVDLAARFRALTADSRKALPAKGE